MIRSNQLNAVAFIVRAIAGLAIVPSLEGCSLDPYQLDDPTKQISVAPKVSDIVKSLRCEIATFIVANKLRETYVSQAITAAQDAANHHAANADSLADEARQLIQSLSFMNIDSKQYGPVGVDLKHVNSLSLSLGFDWKHPNLTAAKTNIQSSNLIDSHIGPTYSDTGIFEYIQVYAITQNTDLGPISAFEIAGQQSPVAGKYSHIYFAQPPQDHEYYCYKSLFQSKSSSLPDAISDLQHLVQNDSGWAEKTSSQELLSEGETLRLLSGCRTFPPMQRLTRRQYYLPPKYLT
jgi:hypothetical protein